MDLRDTTHFFDFMQFSGKNVQNNMFASSPLGLASHLGNPGSTTGYLLSRSNEHKALINANRKNIDIDTGIHEN